MATEEATEEARNPEIWLAGTGEIAAEWTERNRNAMVAMLNFKYEKCAAALKKTPNTVTPTEMAAYLKAQTEHRLRPEQIADCRQSLVFCASCDHVSGANPSCDQCCPSPV